MQIFFVLMISAELYFVFLSNLLLYSMQPECKDGNDYNFFYSDDNPESLVMVYKHHHFLKQLFQIEICKYFWICQSVDQKDKQQILLQSNKKGVSLQLFKNVQDTINFLIQYLNNKDINVVICPPSLTNDIKVYLEFHKLTISYIIEYPPPEDNSSYYDAFQENQTNPIQTIIIQKPQDKQRLNFFLIKSKLKLKQQQMFNFVSLKSQISKSHTLVSIMVAMLNHNTDEATIDLIINDLNSLVMKIKNECHKFKIGSQWQECINLLKRCDLNFEKQFQIFCKKRSNVTKQNLIIYLYTMQQFGLYAVLNQFLRFLTFPAHHFIIQPIFKELVNAIRQSTNQQEFICYRGGILSEAQFNQIIWPNVGQIVQNLGFLSTSVELSVVQLFRKNVLFTIHVVYNKKSQKYNTGFADISCDSSFVGQKQILFNPLNYFKILQVKTEEQTPKNKVIYSIRLLYGSLPQIDNAEQQDSIKSILLDLQRSQIMQQRPSQGDILTNYEYLAQDVQNRKAGLLYWNKYCEIVLRSLGIELATESKISCLKHVLAEEYLKIAKQQQQQIQGKLKIDYLVRGKRSIACIKFQLGELRYACDQYQQCCELMTQLYGPENIVLLQIKVELCNIYYLLGERGKSFKLLISLLQSQYIWFMSQSSKRSYIRLLIIQLRANQQKRSFNQNIKYYNKYLEVLKSNYSCYHPRFIFGLIDKLPILDSIGRYDLAYEQCLKSEQLSRVVFGEMSHHRLKVLCLLGHYIAKLGYLKEALKILSRCLQLQTKILDKHDHTLLRTYEYITGIYYGLENYQEVIKVAELCLQRNKQIYKPNSYQAIKMMGDMAMAYSKLGQDDKAVKLYQKCIEHANDLKQEPRFHIILHNYATHLSKMGKFKKAYQTFIDVQKNLRKSIGQTHPLYISVLKGICFGFIELGKNYEVYPFYQRLMYLSPLLFKSGSIDETELLLSYIKLLQFLGKKEKIQYLYQSSKTKILSMQKWVFNDLFLLCQLIVILNCEGKILQAYKFIRIFLKTVRISSLQKLCQKKRKVFDAVCHFLFQIYLDNKQYSHAVKLVKQLNKHPKTAHKHYPMVIKQNQKLKQKLIAKVSRSVCFLGLVFSD